MTDLIILPPNSKAIPLTKGKFAIVDEENYDWLMQWNWIYRKSGNRGYAQRALHIGYIDKKRIRTTLLMHRVILLPESNMQVDHINGNGLDNRRCNIRTCTVAQNTANRIMVMKKSSKYKGVCWNKAMRKWKAYIKHSYKGFHLGYFDNEEEAALAYNNAAKLYFSEFARLNIIEITPV